MVVLGLRFHATSGKRRILRAVLLDSASGELTNAIEHVVDQSVSQAQQARDARNWLISTLAGFPTVNGAVLFESDRSSNSRDTDAFRQRLRIEGALLTAMLDRTPLVDVRNGKRLGELVAGTKDAAIALGREVGVQSSYAEAAAAALAARLLT